MLRLDKSILFIIHLIRFRKISDGPRAKPIKIKHDSEPMISPLSTQLHTGCRFLKNDGRTRPQGLRLVPPRLLNLDLDSINLGCRISKRQTDPPKENIDMTKVCLLTATWLCLVLAGGFKLYEFYRTPGSQGPSQAKWPVTSALVRAPNKNTLLVFLHAECSCSRATVDELQTLSSAFFAETEMQIVFYKPTPDSADLSKSSLWARASALPASRLALDRSGVEAAIFGAETSGQAYLYDRDGHLLFAGGLTPGRDHAGPSNGVFALNSLLRRQSLTSIVSTPTFGCPITKQNLALTTVGK